jgi:hypothetical protein
MKSNATIASVINVDSELDSSPLEKILEIKRWKGRNITEKTRASNSEVRYV